jgi:hypothetical protein
MEDAVGHGAFDLALGRVRVSQAKTGREQVAHRPVHPQRLGESLLRCHCPVDGHLVHPGGAFMIGMGKLVHVLIKAERDTLARPGVENRRQHLADAQSWSPPHPRPRVEASFR